MAVVRTAIAGLRGPRSSGVSPPVWTRPTDWLPLPTLAVGQQKFVGLVAVYDTGSNWVQITCSGNYTVDWGDGTAPQNASSTFAVNRNLSYSLASGLTSRGYRQSIITITPQAGQNLTSVNVSSLNGLGLTAQSAMAWLDIAMVGASLATLLVGTSNAARISMLEQFRYVGPSAVTLMTSRFQRCTALQSFVGTEWLAGVTNFSGMFSECVSLQEIPVLPTGAGTNFVSMFTNCASLRTIPLLNTSNGTNFSAMFSFCGSLRTIPLIDTAKSVDCSSMFNACTSLTSIPLLNTALCLTFANMFSACPVLRTIPLLNTSKATNLSFMFSGCTSLQAVPLFDTALCTNFQSMFSLAATLATVAPMDVSAAAAGGMSNMFASCFALRQGVLTGCARTISYTGCALSAAELDRIYTALASGVTAQAITVTTNFGNTADTPSIATAKGWTVTG